MPEAQRIRIPVRCSEGKPFRRFVCHRESLRHCPVEGICDSQGKSCREITPRLILQGTLHCREIKVGKACPGHFSRPPDAYRPQCLGNPRIKGRISQVNVRPLRHPKACEIIGLNVKHAAPDPSAGLYTCLYPCGIHSLHHNICLVFIKTI